MRYRLRLNFDRENDLMKMDLRMGFADGDELVKMTVEGDYMADDESITFFADEESLRYKFSSAVNTYAAMAGLDTSDFEEMLEASLGESLGITDIPIYSLSDEKLVIDFEGSKLTLYKQ